MSIKLIIQGRHSFGTAPQLVSPSTQKVNPHQRRYFILLDNDQYQLTRTSFVDLAREIEQIKAKVFKKKQQYLWHITLTRTQDIAAAFVSFTTRLLAVFSRHMFENSIH